MKLVLFINFYHMNYQVDDPEQFALQSSVICNLMAEFKQYIKYKLIIDINTSTKFNSNFIGIDLKNCSANNMIIWKNNMICII